MTQTQPFAHQDAPVRKLTEAISRCRAGLDKSDTGTGKTHVALKVCKELGLEPIIVCPAAVKSQWREACAVYGLSRWIVSYEGLRGGNSGLGDWVSAKKKNFKFFTEATDGFMIIFDEARALKGTKSQNSKLLVAAKKQKIPLLLISATLCDDPTDLKAIGYALGLHDYTGYWSWAKKNGCRQGFFGGLEFVGDETHMAAIGKQLDHLSVRVRKEDVLGFPDHHIMTKGLDVSNSALINAEYTKLMKILEDEAENPLIATLREQQRIEFLKMPEMFALGERLIAEGNSVVWFVQFKESMAELIRRAPLSSEFSVICGGQTKLVRAEQMNNFTNDRTRRLFATIAAGGVGLNLQDTLGFHPRVSLICPTFNAANLKQALGRTNRVNSKTKSTSYIVGAANTVEDRILAKVNKKLGNLSALNDYDLIPDA